MNVKVFETELLIKTEGGIFHCQQRIGHTSKGLGWTSAWTLPSLVQQHV